MNTIVKGTATALLIALITLVDIPLLPVRLIPDAEAIFGVRRRTAVIAYSAGAATASAASKSAAASQQQAAPPPPPPQQAATPQSASAVPIGTVAAALPEECAPVTIGNVQYHECQGSYYRTAFQGNSLVYVVVEKPL